MRLVSALLMRSHGHGVGRALLGQLGPSVLYDLFDVLRMIAAGKQKRIVNNLASSMRRHAAVFLEAKNFERFSWVQIARNPCACS